MEPRSIEAALTARNKIISIAAETAMPAIQIQYIGDKDYGFAGVVDTNDLVLYADDTNGTTTLVATIATDGTPNTMGKVVDAVNATGVFRAFLIGSKRDDLSTAMLVAVAAATCRTTHGITLFYGLAVSAQVFGFGITNQKFLYRPNGGWETFDKGWTKDTNAINSIKALTLTVGTASGNGLWYIYANDDENKQDGVLIHSDAFVDATEESHGQTVPDEIHWSCPRGHRMSVQFLCTTAGSDYDAAVIHCTGHTQDVAGGRVPDANYTGCV